MEARKRTAATPRAAEKSEPPSVAALRAKKEKAKDEKAADSALLASLALGALALALLSGVFVYRERLGLQPLFDRLAGVPAAGNASEPLVPREDSTAPCVIAVPADYHCDDTGCPLPSTSPCAAKYAKLDTVAELRMIDRVLSMVVVSATKPAGSAPVHKLLIGPQNPDEGGKINRFTVQPPTDNCANVVTNLSIASTDPWLVVIDNFLTDAEVDHAMKNGLPGLQPSGQFHGDENAKKAFDKSYRTSSTSYLGKVADEIITCMERRASDFSAYPVANIEALQFLRYEIGQEYKLHWDYFPRGYEAWDAEIAARGQRAVTFFLYLNSLEDDESGGETDFPRVPARVKPKRGRAVFWYDLDADNIEDERTFHAGLPVKKGIKYALNVWIRDRAYSP